MRSRRWMGVALAAVLALDACVSGPAGTAPTTGAANPTGAGSTPVATAPGGTSGADTGMVTGSITTGAPYPATWTWQVGNSAGADGITLNSDKGTFGNVTVDVTGAITFTTGATELAAGSPYRGTGGQVTIKQEGGFPTVCGISLDNDVTGLAGAVVHLKGSLTITGLIHRSDNGLVDIDCS